jgi:hypothetical protein
MNELSETVAATDAAVAACCDSAEQPECCEPGAETSCCEPHDTARSGAQS